MVQNASNDRSALGRVLRRVGGDDVLTSLSALPGADLTTLQLEIARRRAGGLTPAKVLDRHRADRFAAPSPIPFQRMRRAEDVLLSVLPSSFDLVMLSPVVPLGAHSVLATVDQNKVVSTIRGTEVAADPTNGLALEAADRRRAAMASDPRSADTVRLAAVQRVLRAQRFDGPSSHAHFSIFGLVSAGRDAGGLAFERAALADHLSFAADALAAAGADRTEVRLTVLDSRMLPVAESARAALAHLRGVEVVDDPGRESGRGYYAGLCFKVFAVFGGEALELSDGGFVDWTRRLLDNRKERLLISGTGVDRLAMAALG